MNNRTIKYKTAGNIEIYRAGTQVEYQDATKDLINNLDTYKGLLLSSSYEYPGRYNRWDIGFIKPPLQIECRGRAFTILALNERGQLLLTIIEKCVFGCNSVINVQVTKNKISGHIEQAEEILFEEERSRQSTVFTLLREIIRQFKSADDEYLGLYGVFGYELAFQFEKVKRSLSPEPDQRDLVLYLPDEILVVDHQKKKAIRYSYEFKSDMFSTVNLPRKGKASEFSLPDKKSKVAACDHEPGEYADSVRLAKQYFARGDLFEVVPGQMFREKCQDSPAQIFQRLRDQNPSPYGALINLGNNEYLVAASPEMYVRVEGRRIETCPISGTISRGDNAVEDAAQVKTLLASEKDESELSMCTDVDRNDKSRVCEPGSVNIIGRRQVEFYSRLIHTVDHVEGRLRKEFDGLDAFLSHTWAVTVTGAPKHAAMQFLEEHEKSPRRWYGGALGALKFNGDINTGLTLRTIRIKEGVAEVRAGATLLFDSDPDAEERETRLKASALLAAIRNEKVKKDFIKPLPARLHCKVLMVDHQDSFVHTLAAYFRETGADVVTCRPGNLARLINEFNFELVVLSPGPGKPDDFNMKQTINTCLENQIAIFGVCLGLQGIVEYFGGKLGQLDLPMHGKESELIINGGSMFEGVDKGARIGRYHSLVATKVPDCLSVHAKTKDNKVMAVEHSTLPISAVQFHPESLLSMAGDAGKKIIRNVLKQVTMRSDTKQGTGSV